MIQKVAFSTVVRLSLVILLTQLLLPASAKECLSPVSTDFIRFKISELRKELKKYKISDEEYSKEEFPSLELPDFSTSKWKHKIKIFQEYRRCLFQREITAEIKKIRPESENDILKSLRYIGTCLSTPDMEISSLASIASPLFSSIFHRYWKKGDLTNSDCEVLRKTYEVWSSFYPSNNQQNLSRMQSEDEIPVYNVNAHNSSYIYWLKEKIKSGDNWPEKGFPLLHADTHTDLAHVHSHFFSKQFGSTSTRVLTDLVEVLQREGIEEFREKLSRIKVDNKFKMHFKDKSEQEVQDHLIKMLGQIHHHISQPIVGAVSGNITSDIIMVLPPWQTKMFPTGFTSKSTRYDKELKKYKKREVALVEDRGKIQLCRADSKFTSEFQPFSTLSYCGNRTKIKSNLTLVSAWANAEKLVKVGKGSGIFEVETNEEYVVRDFSHYIHPFEASPRGRQFILDIDLDVFVSNGYQGDSEAKKISSPNSYLRTKHVNIYGKHGGHQESSEFDPNVQVLTKEMNVIKARIDSFFDRLEKAKEEGYLPRVITVADSTLLKKLLHDDIPDRESGGNFTPSCLSFLVNYWVRKKLSDIYNVKFNISE